MSALSAPTRWARELQTWLWVQRHYTPDRHVLEHVLLPALADHDGVGRVLFVGVARYTRRYAAKFEGKEFWTIDLDPELARYGADRHIVGSLSNLDRHFGAASLDAIVCNGVLGWGLDEAEEVETAIGHCFECLRPGGILVLGWEEWVPCAPDTIDALARFEPIVLDPFAASRYPTFSYTNHTFDFYARPE